MAGHGPPPNPKRRRRNAPARGEWQAVEGSGWQHGPIPDPPDDIGAAARKTWDTWMKSWWAVHWTPDDLPGLQIVVRLYDQCDLAFRDPTYCYDGQKGTVCINRPNPTTELRQMLDNYGISPKGRQDRRWTRPKDEEEAKSSPQRRQGDDPYQHLRVVNE